MAVRQPRLANFVIGGTEKAGTTSVFDYLCAHPQVCGSSRKETDFFRHDFNGDAAADARHYGAYFAHCDPGALVYMEASPGYLGEATIVAPRLRTLLPEAKLLFVLRDPVERFHSSYQFHRGKLNLPPDLGFDEYLRCCLEYDHGMLTPAQAGLDEWYLKVLRFGCYADCIASYRAQLPAPNIKLMFFEALRQDPRAFMVELSDFLGIDAAFWAQFSFARSNATFSGRNRALHRLAMRSGAVAEPVLRRYPSLKRLLVRFYKALNQEREGYDPMPLAARARLVDYYAPSVRALQQQLVAPLPDSWSYLVSHTVAA